MLPSTEGADSREETHDDEGEGEYSAEGVLYRCGNSSVGGENIKGQEMVRGRVVDTTCLPMLIETDLV